MLSWFSPASHVWIFFDQSQPSHFVDDWCHNEMFGFVVVIHLNTGRTFLTLMNTSTWLCQINISISKQAFHCHQATAPPGVHSAYLSRLTKPASVQVDGDKNGGNSEEVDHRVDLQPEPQLIIGCYELWEIKRRKKSLFYYFTNKQNK